MASSFHETKALALASESQWTENTTLPSPCSLICFVLSELFRLWYVYRIGNLMWNTRGWIEILLIHINIEFLRWTPMWKTDCEPIQITDITLQGKWICVVDSDWLEYSIGQCALRADENICRSDTEWGLGTRWIYLYNTIRYRNAGVLVEDICVLLHTLTRQNTLWRISVQTPIYKESLEETLKG